MIFEKQKERTIFVLTYDYYDCFD